MKAIRIHDNARGLLDFDLKDILAVLGKRAINSAWSVGAVEGHKEEGVDATGRRSSEYDQLALTGTRVSGRHLLKLAKETRQIIWGRFVGYDASSPNPWVVIIAFDSTFFEVRSDDAEALARLMRTFKDVRSHLA
jgi:hypothetical protein